MKKLNSLIYLIYYLLLWVVLPSTGLGERVFASECGKKTQDSITKGDASFFDFQHCINPDWNNLSAQNSGDSSLLRTGHWPVLFSSVVRPQFRFSQEEIVNPIFSKAPILGALTTSIIIFPFHYFW